MCTVTLKKLATVVLPLCTWNRRFVFREEIVWVRVFCWGGNFLGVLGDCGHVVLAFRARDVRVIDVLRQHRGVPALNA